MTMNDLPDDNVIFKGVHSLLEDVIQKFLRVTFFGLYHIWLFFLS